MTDATSQVPSPIEIDSSCMSCGYNLRGLQTEGNCPECGTVISASLHGDLLRFSDANWLERLRFAMGLKLVTLGIMFVLSILAGVLVSLGVTPLVGGFLGLISGALVLWGTFCFTAQEPRVSLQEQPHSFRRVLRILAMIGFVGSIWTGAIQGTPANPFAVGWMRGIGTLLSYGVAAAGFGELFLFRSFAKRVPDPSLIKTTTRYIWTSGIVGSAWILFGIGMVIFMATGGFSTFMTALGAPAPGGFPPAATAPATMTGVTTGVTVTSAGTTTVTTPAGTTVVPGAALPIGWLIAFAVIGGASGIAALVLFVWYIILLIKYKAKFTEAIAQAYAAPSAVPVPQTTDQQPPTLSP